MQYSLILLCLAATTMVASGNIRDIRVELKPLQQLFGGSQDVRVLLNFTNIGQDLMGLLNVIDPVKELMDPIFDVFCNGEQVKYVGAIAKRRAPLLEDFLQLVPGASILFPIKISDVFNMTQACNYVVQLRMNAREFFSNLSLKLKGQTVPVPEDDVVVTSAPVALFAEAHSNKIIQDSVKIAQGRYLTPSYLRCDATQTKKLADGMVQAEKLVDDAYNYMFTKSAATSRYLTWYGDYVLARWDSVKSSWSNIRTTIKSRTITFDCACTQGSSSTYAYVYPSQPYVVYLCGQHWASPLTGTDSQGGTIIHEVAHFTVVAGTQDYAYGQSNAKSLAKSNPTNAIKNSDTFQYFCENNPYSA